MKKHLSLLCLSFAIILSSCNSKEQNVFPDTVAVSKTADLKRVKGTRLFVAVPGAYQPLEKLVRYQKNNDTYFQVIEMQGNSITDYKRKVTPESIEKQGAALTAYEPVKFNSFDGVYFEGPSKTPGETKLALIFGDDSFVTMVMGVCRTADKDSKQELRRIFSQAYYDKSYELNPLELASFTIDETITGFKYAATMGNMFFYSPDGKFQSNGSPEGPGYQVMALEAGSFEKVKELMETVNGRMSGNDVELSNIQKWESTINGYKAYEITANAIYPNGKKMMLYEVGLYQEDPSSGLVFFGFDGDGGGYLDKYKATVQSIRL